MKAKSTAAREKKTLTRLVEEGLKLRLRQSQRPGKGAPSSLPVYRGKGGLVSGVDPLSNRSMFDAADDT